MSYEGYEMHLCAKGHLWENDAYAYMYVEETNKCDICDGPSVWWHAVNETNGYDKDDPSTYPVKLEVATPAKYETCPCCKHTKMLEQETYKIPVKSD